MYRETNTQTVIVMISKSIGLPPLVHVLIVRSADYFGPLKRQDSFHLAWNCFGRNSRPEKDCAGRLHRY